ncbi:MAG TPA: iron-sulfur cluster assembly protein [Solirubrobacteraceae bacterium]|jgi:metal-sulfur cluster biosynthetic enzyme|nr:iron-sulfur cluster assembly protein [Solirubrobacteraceae bacterium]
MSRLASSSSEAATHVTRTPVAAEAAGAPGPGGDLRERVLGALGTVYDPELDEPITSLRFVTECRISATGDVAVTLRLPTPQCAPNFAFLMGADARRAVREVPGVRRVAITLADHYTGDEINRALGRDEGFTGAFPGETDDDHLEALRELFRRKALIARQSRVCEQLLGHGWSADDVVAATVAQLPETPMARRALELRALLDIPCDPAAAAFVAPNGEPLSASQLTRWLRAARLVRTGLEANGGICRSLLEFRHNLPTDPEEVGR